MPWLTPVQGLPLEKQFTSESIGHWQRLALSTAQADPVCCSPFWPLAFYEVFTPKRNVFYLESANGIVLFSEFFYPNGDVALLPLEDSWLFDQPLLGDDAPELLEEALPEIAARYAGKMPAIFISGVREKYDFARSIFSRFSKHFIMYRQNGENRPAAASLAGGVDGWLSRRSANLRANLRKALKRASAFGVTFERWRPDAQNVRNIYERMLAVERKSWKGIGKCGMAETPSKEFYATLIEKHARAKTALVIFARLENEDIGFIFGGTCGSIYRGQQFSYANDYARLSLGNLMQFQKVIWLCELGMERYDMGPVTGERMQYKKHWTEQFLDINLWIMRGK